MGGERKELVLLTAAPIDNGLSNLYHPVMTFALHNPAFATDGIPSLRRLFVTAAANEQDPENLDPDVLFPLADMVSVRRDRRFIETHYPKAAFPDGTPVRFPTPLLTTERYDLDKAHPDLVLEVVVAIDDLTTARYRPSEFRIGDAPEIHEDTQRAVAVGHPQTFRVLLAGLPTHAGEDAGSPRRIPHGLGRGTRLTRRRVAGRCTAGTR